MKDHPFFSILPNFCYQRRGRKKLRMGKNWKQASCSLTGCGRKKRQESESGCQEIGCGGCHDHHEPQLGPISGSMGAPGPQKRTELMLMRKDTRLTNARMEEDEVVVSGFDGREDLDLGKPRPGNAQNSSLGSSRSKGSIQGMAYGRVFQEAEKGLGHPNRAVVRDYHTHYLRKEDNSINSHFGESEVMRAAQLSDRGYERPSRREDNLNRSSTSFNRPENGSIPGIGFGGVGDAYYSPEAHKIEIESRNPYRNRENYPNYVEDSQVGAADLESVDSQSERWSSRNLSSEEDEGSRAIAEQGDEQRSQPEGQNSGRDRSEQI